MVEMADQDQTVMVLLVSPQAEVVEVQTGIRPELVISEDEPVDAIRAGSRALSDELLIALIGGLVTEEALPNYSVSLGQLARDWANSIWANSIGLSGAKVATGPRRVCGGFGEGACFS